MSYFVYILECSDKSYYTGSTSNLLKRITQHNSLKSGAHYTKIRRPVTLCYVEEYQTLAEARKRESQVKKFTRNKKLQLIHQFLGTNFVVTTK